MYIVIVQYVIITHSICSLLFACFEGILLHFGYAIPT